MGSMESFYAGRKGASFVIVKRFDSIDDMVACFEQGGATASQVGYGEYVIIDTIENLKQYSNSDNGKVYRRGLDYDGDLGGAEYIGQIVGPKGAPGGLHIITEIQLDEGETVESVLGTTPPEEKFGAEQAGNAVIIIEYGDDRKQIYVYDYVNRDWVFLSLAGEPGLDPSYFSIIDTATENGEPENYDNKPNEGGLWFVKKEIKNVY